MNTFLETYADAAWTESEKAWVEGKITSRENAVAQVAMIRSMGERTLNGYIDSIELDDGFLDFHRYLARRGIPLTILSDGFDLFIERTLAKYGLRDVRFFANHLIHRDGRFAIEFPHFTSVCRIGAGMCKCARIAERDYCYIGDGVTDLCVARKAGLLFASKYLEEHCRAEGIAHVGFRNFGDILNHLTNLER